eukprot:6183031-Pleurochrysis_carterae.AAC.3
MRAHAQARARTHTIAARANIYTKSTRALARKRLGICARDRTPAHSTGKRRRYTLHPRTHVPDTKYTKEGQEGGNRKDLTRARTRAYRRARLERGASRQGSCAAKLLSSLSSACC